MNNSSGRIDDIEVLRAVAIILTILGHFGELITHGSKTVTWLAVSLWGGVDLFFCISGFVIARTLIINIPVGKKFSEFIAFSVPFYIRRIFRIWPAAFLWIFISSLLTLLVNKSGVFGAFSVIYKDALSALLQVANLHYLQCIGFKVGTCHNLLGIYWSLSLEEQFYILFPFALFLIPRRFMLVGLCVGILSQLFLDRPTWSTMWAVRSDAIMIGVLIAYASMHPAIRMIEPHFLEKRKYSYLFLVIGIIFICSIPTNMYLVTLSEADKPFVWFATGLLAIVSGVLVFAASFNKSYILPEGFMKRLAVYLGTRSYALYLSHNAMFFLTRELYFRLYPDKLLGSAYSIRLAVTGLVLSIIATEMTHRLVELPLRRIGRSKAREYSESYPTTS